MTFGRISILVGQLSDSKLRIGLSVAMGTILFGFFGFMVDAWMTRLSVSDDVHAGLVGAIVGVGAGSWFFFLLAGLRERRSYLADQIRRLAELNHTVRNSLHVITLAQYAADEANKAIVLENTARIDEKLKELFPAVSTPKRPQKRDQL